MKQANPSAGSLVGVGVAGLIAYFAWTRLSSVLAAAPPPAGGGVVMSPGGTVVVGPKTSADLPPGFFQTEYPDQPGYRAPAAPSAGEREALIKRAASGDRVAAGEVDALGWTLNSDQWNYYRAAGGGGQTTVDLFPAGNRGFAMTARDYLDRRAAAGLSGLGYACWGC